MKITFHGAAKTVTGSQHLVEVDGKRILLDCGLYQGRRKDMMQRNRNLPFDPATVDAVVLSHAHIDHSGNIPNLVKSGFTGDIICTHATRDLCTPMLLDSGHIQERDAEYANRHREPNEPPTEPIYTQADARSAFAQFVSHGFGRRKQILPDVNLTFIEAGHMLGSATVILDVKENGNEHDTRLVFSGDIGRAGIPIIRDPEIPPSADVLIMESTYGGRTHDDVPTATRQLKQIINETVRRGGSIVVPAFAVGRTQQLVVQLNELAETGQIPRLPVYVDSPLAVDVTAAFRNHPDAYDAELSTFMEQTNDDDPFGFDMLTYIRSVDDSKALNGRTDPMIIISSSGMIEFGRVVHHLKQRIDDPNSTLLITGWQAPHTLGRRLVDGNETVRIFGREYHPRIQVQVINGFSGHADHDELLQWVAGINGKPRRTFLVHGEEDGAAALAADLTQRHPKMQVTIPNLNQTFEVS